MISIIIPVYNVEQYLEECLESILLQTYKEFEVICINDASQDNSLNILKKYAQKDNRFKIINHKKNKGVAIARNTGLKNVKSEYITFVDADDKVAPTYLENLIKYKDKADCVEVNFQLYFQDDINKDKMKYDKLWYDKFINKKASDIYKIDSKYIKQLNNSCWCKLFKKSIIDKYKIKFSKIFLHEDDEFLLKYIFQCKNIYYINTPLYIYRRHNKSLMSQQHSHNKYTDNAIIAYINIVKYLKKYKLLKNNLNTIKYLAFKYTHTLIPQIIYFKPKSIKKIYKLGKLLNISKTIISKYILKIENNNKFNTNINIENIEKENKFEIIETNSRIEIIKNEKQNQISFNTKTNNLDIKIKNLKFGILNININQNYIYLDEINIIKNNQTKIKILKINDKILTQNFIINKDKNFSNKQLFAEDNQILNIHLELE